MLVQYTWWSFVPKTIYEQFRKFSNCYFLLVIIIQFIPVRISASLSPPVGASLKPPGSRSFYCFA
jgi:hypothetical protein